jgi:sodium transport system ATP-binding protein
MVEVESLSREFRDPKRGIVKAVENVSFSARPGRVLGVLGANGAGKTTLLRTLATILRPTTGRAKVAGHDILAESQAVRRSLGFLSATTAAYGRLTVAESLAFFARLYGLDAPAAARRIGFVAERFGLGQFLNTLGDRLSTGQRQRANIARAVLHDPPVVFFDEPTAGLDVVAAQAVLEFVEECRREGKTILFSSHVMSEAERLCDELLVIHGGTVRAQATPAGLIAQCRAESLESAYLSTIGYTKELAV